jgi:hypothetical protein
VAIWVAIFYGRSTRWLMPSRGELVKSHSRKAPARVELGAVNRVVWYRMRAILPKGCTCIR